ncbi:hypothetical protein I5Q17_23550 [Serratia ureilytica]|uniref:hypothetical protein n=1 Tax=Serratia ureilytica TaxID=300181 RepID=UPI0018D9024A|nr:hypothetical protein [Serratia ureilytica]MBH2947355.1 hypothetical protein [Serratia ureilytica]
MELSVSFSTIVMACLSFLGVYFLIPVVLIGRDFLLIRFVEKYILNDRFWWNLRIFNLDKANFSESFAGRQTQTKITDNGVQFFIDDNIVSENEFQRFEQGRDMHLNRLKMMEPRILMRVNVIRWADKYFKLDSKIITQIDEYSKQIYDQEINLIRKKKCKETP